MGWIIPNIWKINVPNHQPDKVIIELKLVNAVNGQNCKSKMEPKKHFFGVYSIHIKFRGIRYWGIGRFLTCGGDEFDFVPTSDFMVMANRQCQQHYGWVCWPPFGLLGGIDFWEPPVFDKDNIAPSLKGHRTFIGVLMSVFVLQIGAPVDQPVYNL